MAATAWPCQGSKRRDCSRPSSQKPYKRSSRRRPCRRYPPSPSSHLRFQFPPDTSTVALFMALAPLFNRLPRQVAAPPGFKVSRLEPRSTRTLGLATSTAHSSSPPRSLFYLQVHIDVRVGPFQSGDQALNGNRMFQAEREQRGARVPAGRPGSTVVHQEAAFRGISLPCV